MVNKHHIKKFILRRQKLMLNVVKRSLIEGRNMLSDYAVSEVGLDNPKMLTQGLKDEIDEIYNYAWKRIDPYVATARVNQALAVLKSTKGCTEADEFWRRDMIANLKEVKRINELHDDGATNYNY